MEGVLGGEELDLMGQVERGRGGLGEAAFPREDHLRVDKVEATGGDQEDRKSTRLNSSHLRRSRMPSSA